MDMHVIHPPKHVNTCTYMHVKAQIPESRGIGVGLGNVPTNYLSKISKVY